MSKIKILLALVMIILLTICLEFVNDIPSDRSKNLSESSRIAKEVKKNNTLLNKLRKKIKSQNSTVLEQNKKVDELSRTLVETRKSIQPITIVSHRGLNTDAPEESMADYKLAIDNGFTDLEGDVHFTSDGVAVMMHDETINRIARNSDGSTLPETVTIKDTTYTDLSKYDYGIYKSAMYAGTGLLTYEELVKLASESGVALHIELKENYTFDQKQYLYNIATKYNMQTKIGWQSFNWDELNDFDSIDPNAQLELLAGSYSLSMLFKAQNLNNGMRNIVFSLNSSASLNDISTIIAQGYQVYIWTVDSSSDIVKYLNSGISAIMTNGSRDIENNLLNEEQARNLQELQNSLQENQTTFSSEKETLDNLKTDYSNILMNQWLTLKREDYLTNT